MIFGFIVLFSTLVRVAHLTKCLFLNDEPCVVRPTLIIMNSAELKYYQLMISLNKCIGNCNVLPPKINVPKETKDIIVKASNMIANKDEAKAMTEHISCDCNCKFNSTTCNSNQKCNNKGCQSVCKNYHSVKKIIVGILTHVFVKIVSI